MMKRLFRRTAWVLFGILISATSANAQQTVRYVSNTDPTCGAQSPCYNSIQAAIDAADQSDVVRILAGTYAEQLHIEKNSYNGAVEADRILLEADPNLQPGQVVLTGNSTGSCTNNYGIRIRRTNFLTIRGLTINGHGAQAITLQGGNNGNRGIHVELNRIFGNGLSNNCSGAIDIAAGNPGTIVANNLIYNNGRNAIVLSGTGGPHYIVNNTVYSNAWNGIDVSADQQAVVANNIINKNGTASGNQGARFGIKRDTSSTPVPQTLQLLSNLICSNSGGEIGGPVLDSTDSGNFTPVGNEGPGVSSKPGCGDPANLFINVNGQDNLPNTADDDFQLKQGSFAIDIGMDPRTLGLNPAFNAIFEADFRVEGIRPADGNANRTPAFDASAFEYPNAPPTANAGNNQTVYRGELVALDGSRSTDSEGAPLSYLWAVVSQPAGSNIARSYWKQTGAT